MTVNVGVVKVPDERLTKLTELFKPKREVPADVTYVDLPAPPLSLDGREAAEIPADQLARLRTADELLHVVRAFENPAVPHPDGSVDAAARRRAARPRVRPGRPRRGREAHREAVDAGPPRHTGGARGKRARARRPGEDRCRRCARATPIRDIELTDDERSASAASAS